VGSDDYHLHLVDLAQLAYLVTHDGIGVEGRLVNYVPGLVEKLNEAVGYVAAGECKMAFEIIHLIENGDQFSEVYPISQINGPAQDVREIQEQQSRLAPMFEMTLIIWIFFKRFWDIVRLQSFIPQPFFELLYVLVFMDRYSGSVIRAIRDLNASRAQLYCYEDET
jgi:hypothetical protein